MADGRHWRSTEVSQCVTIQRPPGRRFGAPRSSRSFSPAIALRPNREWANGHELSCKLKNLDRATTTYDIYRNFSMYGKIVYIELFEDKNGDRDGAAKVKFSPPPQKAFWTGLDHAGSAYLFPFKMNHASAYLCRLEIMDDRNKGPLKIRSPIKNHIWYNARMKLIPAEIHFGIMEMPDTMQTMHVVEGGSEETSTLELDLVKNRLTATFNVKFIDPRSQGDLTFTSQAGVSELDRINKYMLYIPFDHVSKIEEVEVGDSTLALLVSTDGPPQFYKKRMDEKACHSSLNNQWTEFESWYRATDIVYDPYNLKKMPLSLHKQLPVIDIGRWTTYKFVLNKKQNSHEVYKEIRQALEDFNIKIERTLLKVKSPSVAQFWDLIDPPHLREGGGSNLQHLQNGSLYLDFEVRYQLEVCISRDYLNEYNLSEEFFTKLSEVASKDVAKARNLLEYVADKGERIFEPMSIFADSEALAFSPKTEIPHYCAYARKATITPTTICFSTPTVETTNRVLRHYSHENSEGRFLRVQFTDELSEGRINSSADLMRNDEIFTRVYRTLYNGIRIGDRLYKFLAFGNSQFRENGAYFFCETQVLTCDDIRNWMGSFSHIKVVAKYAARLGQCFSTTRAIKGLSAPDIVKIPDIERNEFCFTDGVGKISPFLAQMITADLGLRVNIPPSAFQFRLGGCKGVLVVSPDAKDKEIHIRKSQQKFTSVYNGLEIIRWSRFSSAALNRQTITILSALGVPDEVFLQMLTEQLSNYQIAMSNDALAQSLLVKYIDDNQMTINIATMINNGFMAQREPFVLSLLHLWRSWSVKLLKEKAKIIVESGAFLLGGVDETGTLKGYVTPSVKPMEEFKIEELAEIFVQVPSKEDPNVYNVIEGICLVGRNPSLHPGDLRVVRAVNVEALHHIRDVIIFPQTGERDIPSMCSGGDLDGDDFFVIWDEHLRPSEWNAQPMNYIPPEPIQQVKPVSIVDLMKFFVRFIKNDSLPTIAHAHLAHADRLTESVKHHTCLELATLHSKAVDYVKTGQEAKMPKSLRVARWPHFMEKKYKRKEQIYTSTNILGQLYDKVESVGFVPQYEGPFDKRILSAYSLDNPLLKTVRQIKSKYDTAMRQIMAQYEIKTEFEVWSTFVLSKRRVGSDYKVQEEMGRISDQLKDRFRLVCIDKAGSKEFTQLGPFVAAMYKVTKEEMDIALAECRATKMVAGKLVPRRKMEPRYMPLMSFPWLFEKELGRIATGIEQSELDSLLPSRSTKGLSKKRAGASTDVEDFIHTEDGHVIHRGEELDLFRELNEYPSDDSDLDETRSTRDYREPHDLMMDEFGDVVFRNEFQPKPLVDLSETGVEDVVPQTELDGFINPMESAIHSHEGLAHRPATAGHNEIIGSPTPPKSIDSKSTLSESTYHDLEGLASPGSEPQDESKEETCEEEVTEVVELEIEETPFEKFTRLNGP